MEDSENIDSCCSSSESTNTLNSVVSNKNKSLEDDRIECSNSYYLDKIYEVAVQHVTELAESHLNEDKQQFITRFSEVFKNYVEQNVTVKGFPWIANEEKPSTDEKEELTPEKIDGFLSKLSKTVEKTAEKRKVIPKECAKIYGMQLKHEKQNMKRARIEPPESLHSVQSLPSPTFEDKNEEVLAIYENTVLVKQDVEKSEERLSTIIQRIEFANDVAKQHQAHSETLYDTGYQSE